MKTKVEIINETVDYYSTDTSRRAITTNKWGHFTCLYKMPDGRNCAVGRCLIKPPSNSLGIRDLETYKGELDNLLKPEYREHSLSFWEDLQEIHDTPSYWNSEGMTERGKDRVNILLEYYKN